MNAAAFSVDVSMNSARVWTSTEPATCDPRRSATAAGSSSVRMMTSLKPASPEFNTSTAVSSGKEIVPPGSSASWSPKREMPLTVAAADARWCLEAHGVTDADPGIAGETTVEHDVVLGVGGGPRDQGERVERLVVDPGPPLGPEAHRRPVVAQHPGVREDLAGRRSDAIGRAGELERVCGNRLQEPEAPLRAARDERQIDRLVLRLDIAGQPGSASRR